MRRPAKRMIRAPESGAGLDTWLTFLESLHPQAMDLGLERVLQVYRRLFPRGFPVPAVVIGGTNGKGSTALTLEWILRSRGLHTATYMSPHLNRYNERVRIDGADASDADLVAAFEAVETARGEISLTYFEFGTLAAFWLFARTQADIALLEVGLGGRLDAVNVVDARLAVICSVDLDHCDWLGDDRESVGFEKAGILRPGIDAVYGESAPPMSVLQQAAAQRVALRFYGRDFGDAEEVEACSEGAENRVELEFDGRLVGVELTEPLVPRRSAINALQAAALLGIDPRELDLDALAREVKVPGRFEQMGVSPAIILDVGHNPHAARWLAGRLRETYPGRRVIALYASLADKNCEGVVRALNGVVESWFLAGLDVPRGLSTAALSGRVGSLVSGSCHSCATVQTALEEALAEADDNAVVVIFGSFFTVGLARTILRDKFVL